MFGEKDYQQLKVVTRMARDLDIPLKVVGCRPCGKRTASPCRRATFTCRPTERRPRPLLYRVLKDSAARIQAGESNWHRCWIDGRHAIEAAGFTVDYLEARHADSWSRFIAQDGPIRLLVAASSARPG